MKKGKHMQKDLAWFVNERQKKMVELEASRKRSRKLNKEIKDLNRIIADNLKHMVLTGETVKPDDEENGWVYQSAEELNDQLKVLGLADSTLKVATK